MSKMRMANNHGAKHHFHRDNSSSLVWARRLAVFIVSSLLIFENVRPANSSTIQAEYDSIKPKPKLVIVETTSSLEPSPLSSTTLSPKTSLMSDQKDDHQHSGSSRRHHNNNNNNNNNNDNKNNHHGGSNYGEHGEDGEKSPPPRRFPVAKFDFEHVSGPYIILLWIIIVGLAKMGFHVTPKLSSICPESVVLMILGVMIGLIMYFAGIPEERLQPLTPELFFLYMLPPIVMDAGYHMPNRLFFDNLVSILLYAVVGTIWNTMAIGLSLYGCSKWGLFGEEIPFLDLMLFSSTVSAVDPVAVLAVFEEIHVNEVLYILVFGESLLNDGVTVVLYHMFEGYAEIAYHYGIDSLQPIDYISGVASFFVVAIGGTAMGVFWGFLAAFVSRFTHHVKIIEPIFVFVMAYLSYLSAEMFHLSGILSLTFCGITMKNYVEENITQKSHTTLKYAMKMLANSSEAIIFVFLGVCTVNDQHHWNTPFVMCTIIFCLVYRTIGVVALTSLTNRFRLHKVNGVEQFIMAYGGLRGAVAFALILIIDRQIIHAREMFVTTIIAMVYFTVFLQGMTVGTLVKILNVPRANKFELTMNERIHTRLMDHLMAGVEDISGMMMGNYKLRDKFRHYNNQFLRKWLLRDSKEMGNSSRKIFETCSRLDLRDAMTLVSKQHLLAATAAAAVSSTSNNNNSVKRQTPDPRLSFAFANANYVITDEDEISDTNNNNNNNKNNNYSNKRPSLPKMFLNVPVNPAFATSVTRDQATCVSTPPPSLIPIISANVDVGGGLVDPNQALSQFLRTYTQSNLSALNDDDDDNNSSNGGDQIEPNSLLQMATDDDQTNLSSTNNNIDDGILLSPMTNGTVDFNYDIGGMVYSPSLKDLKDAELHHILNDAMFKPFKKAHHYCRSDYHDEDEESSEPHPPFQHQVRMHIRKLLTEKQNERHRRHSHQHFYNQQQPPKLINPLHHPSHHHHHHHHHHSHHHPNSNNGAQNAHSPHNQNPATNLKQISERKSFRSNNNSDEDDDQDGGITFVAGSGDHDEANRSRKIENTQLHEAEKEKKDEEEEEDDEAFPEKVDERRPRLSFPWRRRSSVATSNSGETDFNNPDSSVTSISSANNHEIASAASAIVANIHRSSTTAARKRRLQEGVVRQREFPAWINNRDYVDGYGSPTITLLERISFFEQKPESMSKIDDETATKNAKLQQQQQQQQQQQSSNQKKVPSVYEIFQLDKIDGHSDDVPNTSTSKQAEQNPAGSNDTVIEFKHAPQTKNGHKTDREVEEDEDSSLVIISKL